MADDHEEIEIQEKLSDIDCASGLFNTIIKEAAEWTGVNSRDPLRGYGAYVRNIQMETEGKNSK